MASVISFSCSPGADVLRRSFLVMASGARDIAGDAQETEGVHITMSGMEEIYR